MSSKTIIIYKHVKHLGVFSNVDDIPKISSIIPPPLGHFGRQKKFANHSMGGEDEEAQLQAALLASLQLTSAPSEVSETASHRIPLRIDSSRVLLPALLGMIVAP